MNFYSLLENPKIYNFIEKILSLGNKSCEKSLSELIRSREGDRILDVGCGTARYAKLFRGKYYGTDINADYIRFAGQNYDGDFSVMDAADMKFPDEHFDFVFNVGIFHHMPDTVVVAAIREMKRVCRKGGEVFVIEAVYPPKRNLLGYLLFKFDRGRYTRTLGRLREMLEGEGCRLLKSSIPGSFPYKLCVFNYKKI